MIQNADADAVRALASVPGVARIRAMKTYFLTDSDPVADATAVVQSSLASATYGVNKINAPDVWAHGDTGQGVVVGTIDTGAQFDHPALVGSYRGNLGNGLFDHDYNWYDPLDTCFTPCTVTPHGTHVTGTIAGGDALGPFANDIGVAPGAKWITALGCQSGGGCAESTLLGSGQFMLAPTDRSGNNPDPAKRPQVVSNSWGGAAVVDPFYSDMISAWRAAGIVPVFSAGNAGPNCSTLGTPGNSGNVVSAGATDENDNIALFSSRGPFGTRVGPNVVAPGVHVLSSIPGNAYDSFNGTSMAAPHVAGTIALLLAVRPDLVGQVDTIAGLLESTAVAHADSTCGGTATNNGVYGHGRIDAKALYDAVVSTRLVGTVTDGTNPIAGAQISVTNGSLVWKGFTAANGTYEIGLPPGAYTGGTVTKFGYFDVPIAGFDTTSTSTVTRDVALVAKPTFTISGTVRNPENQLLGGTSVALAGVPVPAVTTDANGFYAFTVPDDTYSLRVHGTLCGQGTNDAVTVSGSDVTRDVTLAPKQDLAGHTCAPIAVTTPFTKKNINFTKSKKLVTVHLPFNFPYYGRLHRYLYVAEDGWLTFEKPFKPEVRQPPLVVPYMPNAGTPNNAVYVLAEDMVVLKKRLQWGIIGTEPNRSFVLQWKAVFGEDNHIVNAQITLWENGNIDLTYGDLGGETGVNAVIGIEDRFGADGLLLDSHESLLTPNSAIRISP